MSIYLDSNATSQVHPRVVDAMMPYLTDSWHNPSSGYSAGRKVKAAVERAREQIASLIGAEPEEIVFTGCGTESNNMAIRHLADEVGTDGRILVSEIEHSAVLRPTEALAEQGYEVEQIGVDGEGRLDLAALDAAIDSTRPGFVSIMWANNETGVVQPMADICERAKRAGWRVHTDAIQAVGKVPVRVDEVPVDLLSISGHKFHAPKGIGVLFIRSGSDFAPMIRGGGQERGARSGTENVPYIVGIGEAAAIMQEELSGGGMDRVQQLRDQLESKLAGRIEGVALNGSREHRTGNVAHVSFEGCVAGEMLPLLDSAGLQCSAGSACMTGKNQPSHVQKAMGFSDERAFSSLRFSLSIFSSEEEVSEAVGIIADLVETVRR